jgi:hypothetical protein
MANLIHWLGDPLCAGPSLPLWDVMQFPWKSCPSVGVPDTGINRTVAAEWVGNACTSDVSRWLPDLVTRLSAVLACDQA